MTGKGNPEYLTPIRISHSLVTIGHTYDVTDLTEPVITDLWEGTVQSTPDGLIDLRCAKPGRPGCRGRTHIMPSAGHDSQLIVVEHDRSCRWMAANLRDMDATSRARLQKRAEDLRRSRS